MNQYKRPEKELDPAKKPGQIVNPIPESLLYKPTHGGYPDVNHIPFDDHPEVDDTRIKRN